MNSEVVGDSESNSSDQGDDKTFINKLLVEMKSQFNRTDCKKQASVVENSYVNEASSDLSTEDSVVINHCTNNIEEENDAVIVASDNVDLVPEEITNSSLQEIESKTKDESDEIPLNIQEEILDEDLEHGKPRIVLTFRKPNKPKPSSDDTNLGRRSLRHKITAAEENLNEKVLKRSARRRSKDCSESVLQSAIARKEKSYNESNKPQRLTRQLKPTQKILENIATAALKLEKNKGDIKSRVNEKQKLTDMDGDIYPNTDDNETDDTKDIENAQKKHKHKHHHNKHSNAKKLKVNNEKLDSDSDQSGKSIRKSDSSSSLSDNSKASSKNSKVQVTEEKPYRRSQRISSRYVYLLLITAYFNMYTFQSV